MRNRTALKLAIAKMRFFHRGSCDKFGTSSERGAKLVDQLRLQLDERYPFRSRKLRIYSMRSSMSLGWMIRFGIVGCIERDHTVSAVTDMPGVLAICLNGGALLFGDAASLRWTL